MQEHFGHFSEDLGVLSYGLGLKVGKGGWREGLLRGQERGWAGRAREEALGSQESPVPSWSPALCATNAALVRFSLIRKYCYCRKTQGENTHTAHICARTLTPTPSLTQMTACHGLYVTSQLRPPPCQPLMSLGATVAPHWDTAEGRGMLPQERPPSPKEATTCQSEGNWRLGGLISFHPSTSILNSMAIKKKIWCGSTVASDKFLNIPALSFSICTMGGLCPPQGHPTGSPWLRGCQGSPSPCWSFLQPPLLPTLPGPWSLKSELSGRGGKAGTDIWGGNGSPALDPVSGQL